MRKKYKGMLDELFEWLHEIEEKLNRLEAIQLCSVCNHTPEAHYGDLGEMCDDCPDNVCHSQLPPPKVA